MFKTYPERPCLHCERPHTLRGDYCSGRCRVAAWRETREPVAPDDRHEDDEAGSDIEFQTTNTGRLWVVGEDDKYLVCAHPDCWTRLPAGSHAKFCSNACRQDHYRLRKNGKA